MKRLKFSLLLLLAVILCPKISKAQSQSLFAASSTSTKKQGYSTPYKVVKTQAHTPFQIVTLVQVNKDTSAFDIMSDNGSTIYSYVSYRFPNKIIEDFYILENTIYFCGKAKLSQNNYVGVVGTANISSLNSSLAYNEYILDSSIAEIEKIDVYKDASNQVKLSLIGNAGCFIDFNLSTLSYNRFSAVFGLKLLDVVHTNDYIGVLGMENDSTFTLFSHDKQDPTTIILGYGKKFITPSIYDNIDNEPRYYIEALDDGLNNIVVGYASKRESIGLEFCNIDLSNIAVNNSQGISNEIFLRTKFADLKYNKSNQSLLCLVYNQNAYTSFDDNILEQIQPYNTSAYNIYVTIPDPNSYRNLLTCITPYAKAYYLAAGKNVSDSIYWFDKILGYNENACNKIMNCEVVPIENPRWDGVVYYRYNRKSIEPNSYKAPIGFHRVKVICQ